jgi:hypothetical protein
MNDTDAVVQYADTEIEMRFEPLEVTPDLVMNGLTLWDTPIRGEAVTRLRDGIRELLELPWDAWAPTVGVSEISISTEPSPVTSPWGPHEVTWARVSIFGYGFIPAAAGGVGVTTKWNNAFGFPDNGEGANSIYLQSPLPDANGRFAFQVLHRGVRRPAKEWRWELNNQLVLDAQQRQPDIADWRRAHQRGIPPHVLWQWVPYAPTINP